MTGFSGCIRASLSGLWAGSSAGQLKYLDWIVQLIDWRNSELDGASMDWSLWTGFEMEFDGLAGRAIGYGTKRSFRWAGEGYLARARSDAQAMDLASRTDGICRTDGISDPIRAWKYWNPELGFISGAQGSSTWVWGCGGSMSRGSMELYGGLGWSEVC